MGCGPQIGYRQYGVQWAYNMVQGFGVWDYRPHGQWVHILVLQPVMSGDGSSTCQKDVTLSKRCQVIYYGGGSIKLTNEVHRY